MIRGDQKVDTKRKPLVWISGHVAELLTPQPLQRFCCSALCARLALAPAAHYPLYSILLAERNVTEALKISDRKIVVKPGAMIKQALPEDLSANVELMELY